MLKTDSGLLVPVRSKEMPYPPKFEHALQGIAHGWKPKNGSLKNISQRKAGEMLDEAKRKGRREGQAKALKEA